MKEEAVLFGNANTLVGTITNPERTINDLPAIILLNAGLIHRVGPNRIYVKVARKMAELGILVFRFDHSGIGDSGARTDNLPVDKSVIAETQEAMDYLSAAKGIKRFVLMGICSGAETSAQTACFDPRVEGVILVNTLYYQYSRAIADRVQADYYRRYASHRLDKWFKVFTGSASYGKIFKAIQSQVKNAFRLGKQHTSSQPSHFESELKTMLGSLKERGIQLLLVYNETPYDIVYLEMLAPQTYRQMAKSGQLIVETIPNAGHTFPLLETQDQLCQRIQNWVVFSKHRATDKVDHA
jgi:dienelactone hydrolase